MSGRAPAAPLKGWRRRPDVRYEGTETHGAAFGDEPTPRWHLWGPHAAEDLRRVMKGLICIRCFQPFPDRLHIGTRRMIMRDCGPFVGRSDHQVALLIDAGRCPYCTAEVSPEMATAFFEGYVTRTSDPAELRPGEHGRFEGLIERGNLDGPGELYLPPGWDR